MPVAQAGGSGTSKKYPGTFRVLSKAPSNPFFLNDGDVRISSRLFLIRYNLLTSIHLMNTVILSPDIRMLLVLEMKAKECTKGSKDALSEHFFKNYRK